MKITGERTVATDNPTDTRYRLVFDDLTDGEITGLLKIHRRAAVTNFTTDRVTSAATDAIRKMLAVEPADGEKLNGPHET